MKNDNTSVDIDFAEAAVPHYARRGIVTMFMIMLGFTFFSASMWVGKELADGLDFGGFIISMIIGGLILSLYTGLLGYVGAETGMSLDLLARKAALELARMLGLTVTVTVGLHIDDASAEAIAMLEANFQELLRQICLWAAA